MFYHMLLLLYFTDIPCALFLQFGLAIPLFSRMHTAVKEIKIGSAPIMGLNMFASEEAQRNPHRHTTLTNINRTLCTSKGQFDDCAFK